ncbi:MAG: class I SAM-dependent methyltransferase [Deltaproteobacteria bacterium]|nr:class I SAM-dependent methyltransferase [Deltaproteobacteria bacterium]
MKRLHTRPIQSQSDLVAHFDAAAQTYQEAHGPAARLLAYRLALVRRCYHVSSEAVLLEIGCGTGIHLIALADEFARAIGTDISEAMIQAATAVARQSPVKERIDLRVDAADELWTIADASIDVVLCVGAFEHMLHKARVLRQVYRVLKPDGVFVCLTPNGDYWWYTSVAPRLRLAVKHLSTDHFVTLKEMSDFLRDAEFTVRRHEYWRFIPKGDMPSWVGWMLEVADRLGQYGGLSWLRGGLVVVATKGRKT